MSPSVLLSFCGSREGVKNAACGVGHFRVRRLQSPRAAFGFPLRGVRFCYDKQRLFLFLCCYIEKNIIFAAQKLKLA